jgi:uncharacterized membrane protein
MRLGIYIYGLATVFAGLLDLLWGEFEAAHQPIQALGDHIPGQQMLAYVVATWLIAGGLAILWSRTARFGAIACAIIYFIFTVFWLVRLHSATHFLGYSPKIIIGVLSGVAQQLILVVAGTLIYACASKTGPASRRTISVARWIFGLCSVDFGLAHLTGVPVTATFVPKWIPFGGAFWAILTGICFVLAGLAILSRILDVLAARLLALMLLVFSALMLAPKVFASPHDHIVWGSNAYNLAAVGATWIFAEFLEPFAREFS